MLWTLTWLLELLLKRSDRINNRTALDWGRMHLKGGISRRAAPGPLTGGRAARLGWCARSSLTRSRFSLLSLPRTDLFRWWRCRKTFPREFHTNAKGTNIQVQAGMSFGVVTASFVVIRLAGRLVPCSRIRIALRSAYFRRDVIGCRG